MTRSFRRALISLLLLSVVVASLSCAGGGGDGEEEKASDSLFKKVLNNKKTIGVTTALVTAREVPLVITEDGKTEAADRYVAKAPGKIRIQTLFIEEGARVRPGDPLVKFSDDTLELRLNLARAEVREAEAGLAAVGAPERSQPREGNGEGEPEEEPTDLENLNVSEARTNLYQAQLDRARAQQELYEKMVELDQLNSPIAGIVGRVMIGEGSTAVEDQELLQVAKIDPLSFRFKIAVDDVVYLERGSDIVVQFPSFPRQDFPAEVASVGTDAGSGNRLGVEVNLTVPNPDLLLKSDMEGTVEIRTSGRRKVVSVPETAIVRTERSAYVYKLEDEKANRVAVDLGTTTGSQVEIEKGLSEGDTVITSADGGMESLRDGAKVEIQSERAGG